MESSPGLDLRVASSIERARSMGGRTASESQPVLTTPATVALGYAAVVGYAAEGAAFTAGATIVIGAYTVGKAAG